MFVKKTEQKMANNFFNPKKTRLAPLGGKSAREWTLAPIDIFSNKLLFFCLKITIYLSSFFFSFVYGAYKMQKNG